MNQRMRGIGDWPEQEDKPACCFSHSDCFAFQDWYCMALRDSHFSADENGFCQEGADCPFYKTVEENQAEQRTCLQRLVHLGRTDLIEKYEREMRIAGVFRQDFTDGVQKEMREYRDQYRQKLMEKAAGADEPDTAPEAGNSLPDGFGDETGTSGAADMKQEKGTARWQRKRFHTG